MNWLYAYLTKNQLQAKPVPGRLYAYNPSIPQNSNKATNILPIKPISSTPNQNPYKNQYGNQSTTPRNFLNHFKGKRYEQIITGNLILHDIPIVHDINLNVPNFVETPYNFINLSNGKQVDMVHFLVVGKEGHLRGTANEIIQLIRNPKSAFYAQDLYSNRLGTTFFSQYADKLAASPNRIADYIYEFLSNPNNI